MPRHKNHRGAFIVRIGLWVPLYYTYKKEAPPPPNSGLVCGAGEGDSETTPTMHLWHTTSCQRVVLQ